MSAAAKLPLTAEEARAVASLRRLAKRWPKSLWLFSACGTLHVMKKAPDGSKPEHPDPYIGASMGATVTDQRMSVETIDTENDGGDW